jgi:predicted dehydrogenase/nucleoside-diphosphate-sugar epimerase
MSDTTSSVTTPTWANRPIRSAIVGTGYIADFHARAIREIEGVELACSCDPNLKRAQSFANTWNIPLAFESLDSMLRDTKIDCIHILTPPDLHFSLAKAALQLGVHVFLEKPMCTSVAEADELVKLAHECGLHLAVSHNFMFTDAFERLRRIVNSKTLGPIDQITFNHLYELGQIRHGPFDSWMLRAPGNVILETGPHLISALLEIVGNPVTTSVIADRKVTLPNGNNIYRRWRVRAEADRTAIDLNMNFGPGLPQRTIFVRGLLGTATVDFDANTCIIDQRTPLDMDLDRYRRSSQMARQTRSQARGVLAKYVLGKLKLMRSGNPYQSSINASTAAFYSAIGNRYPLDTRIAGTRGRDVIEHCVRIITTADVSGNASPTVRQTIALSAKPKVLVLGGAGFIGQELLRHLLAAGHCVRAMVRGSGSSLERIESDRLETVRGDVRNQADLESAMQGIEYVYHLAHAHCKTWDEYQRNDIEPTRLVGEVCLASKVKRLVYTGTIDSYYAGAKAGIITEATPLDSHIGRRNYYARAKAAAERILTDMYRQQELPLVIARPGIVIGRGGNPFHWGVGRFSEDICEVWGDGNNKLPLVLVSDVASALVNAIEVPAIEGRSFNLIDGPLLTALEYLGELQKTLEYPLRVIPSPILKFYLADLAKWAVKMVVRHPDASRVPSYSDWESRTQKAFFNCDRTRADLGWAPASDRQRMIAEGIRFAVEPWLEAIK